MENFQQQGQFKGFPTPSEWNGTSWSNELTWYTCFDDKDSFEGDYSTQWNGEFDQFGNQTHDKRASQAYFANFGGNSQTFTTLGYNSNGDRYIDFTGNSLPWGPGVTEYDINPSFMNLNWGNTSTTTFTNFFFLRYLNSTSSRWEMFSSNRAGNNLSSIDSFNLRLENNKVTLYQIATPRHTWTSTSFSTGNDYKIIYTVNGSVITLYVNGTNMGNYTMGWNYGPYDGLGFSSGDKSGKSYVDTLQHGAFSQGIYKFGSFSKVLTSSEITQVNNLPLGAFP